MSKKQHHEEHEEHPDETWLVPYSDVLTLLLALFIVLFAVSQTDKTKVVQMAESFKQAFSEYSGILPYFNSITPPAVPRPPTPTSTTQPTPTNFQKETAELKNIQTAMDAFIMDNKLDTQFETSLTDEGLLITIKDNLLFRSGSADLRQEALPIARSIATMLSTITQRVIIGGHSDNLQISTREFPTNWDLSAKRAVNFMRYMLEHDPFIRPERFSAAAYGEYRPIASNFTEFGRQQNRRVEIFIMRDYPRDLNPTVPIR